MRDFQALYFKRKSHRLLLNLKSSVTTMRVRKGGALPLYESELSNRIKQRGNDTQSNQVFLFFDLRPLHGNQVLIVCELCFTVIPKKLSYRSRSHWLEKSRYHRRERNIERDGGGDRKRERQKKIILAMIEGWTQCESNQRQGFAMFRNSSLSYY